MTLNSKNIFYELVKDLSTYSKSDILILARKWSIPFVNKSQAVNVIAYKIFLDNFVKIGNIRPEWWMEEDKDENKDENKDEDEDENVEDDNVEDDEDEDVDDENKDNMEEDEDEDEDEGMTELVKASLNGDIELVNKLLKYGADVNASNNRGDTALMLAKKKHIKDLLRKYGAN